MVKIRLKRIGKRHQPFYRIVAAYSESPRKGKYLEKIGIYDPSVTPPKLVYDRELLDKWLKAGAQMTDTVSDAFTRAGIIKQSKLREFRISKLIETNKKAKEKKAKEKPVEAPVSPATKTPPAPTAPAEPKAAKKAEVVSETPKSEPPKPEKASEAKKEVKPAASTPVADSKTDKAQKKETAAEAKPAKAEPQKPQTK